ncbi:Cyclomaltodextrinase [compost metagenome]
MKLAALFQFTYSGTPCIYYGSEVGIDGDMDPGCRKCMEWDQDKQDKDLFSFYQKLISVRKELAPLRTGSIRFLTAEEGGSKLAYERKLDRETVIVLLNKDDIAQTLEVESYGKSWKDAFSGQVYEETRGKLNVRLSSYGYAVLTEV